MLEHDRIHAVVTLGHALSAVRTSGAGVVADKIGEEIERQLRLLNPLTEFTEKVIADAEVLAITRPLYQQRVIEEAAELDKKLEALRSFTGNHVFPDLDLGEQHRLKRQLSVMAEYSDLLHQRIAAFK